MNVSVGLLFFEERQGSQQLRAGVSDRDAEERASNAVRYIRKRVAVPAYM